MDEIPGEVRDDRFLWTARGDLVPADHSLTVSAGDVEDGGGQVETLLVPAAGDVLTAAGEVMTGAMIALLPSAVDAARLAVDGGETADQLHCTLMYLGTAADISADVQQAITDTVRSYVDGWPALTVDGFAISLFNPPGMTRDDGLQRDTCVTLGLSGDDLDIVHEMMVEAVDEVADGAGLVLPDQHTPWHAHLTLTYTVDSAMVGRLLDRCGPVVFDRVRVAFAGENVDIPLDGPDVPTGLDDYAFQSRMPAQLKSYWIRRLAPWGHGAIKRCVRQLRKHYPVHTEGLCANLEHEATGHWPGEGHHDSGGGPDFDAQIELGNFDRFARDQAGRFARKGGGHLGPAATPKPEVPLTPAALEQRQRKVTEVMGRARKSLATDITHAKDGAWDPDRDRLHRQIAADLYTKAAGVPNEGKAVIAGGLGGSGKSSVLRGHAGIDPGQYLTLNPDDVKEELAARGMVPEVPDAPELSPMERASLVHEESSRITHLLADMAYRDRKNVIWDVTLSSKGSAQSRVDALKRHGYTDVRGVFVDIPVEVSVKRALSRYQRGLEQWGNGQGQGGRFVPPDIIRAQATSVGGTINRGVFDSLRNQFTGSAVYDNSVDGRAPQLVDERQPAMAGTGRG